MGLLWWRKGNKTEEKSSSVPKSNGADTTKPLTEAPGMNGAVEVPRPANTTVSIFEFGSVAASNDKVTLAGYCPVSEDLEPCRWEILPALQSNAPQFRVLTENQIISHNKQAQQSWLIPEQTSNHQLHTIPVCISQRGRLQLILGRQQIIVKSD
ncbi:hypothetical protein VNO78_07981 [Psophocarpus tetragonolobus]|uniref:Uncharacterized protein n=1 Tax=Psophocarpus tetragonolobus TaxID=3891 RepID=A0AAN9XS68_PSOTE